MVMWVRCPQLKTIGTSIGSLPLGSHVNLLPRCSRSSRTDAALQLFEFRNLKGFSLAFKGDVRPDEIDVSLSGRSRLLRTQFS